MPPNFAIRIGILVMVWSAAVLSLELAQAADPSFDCSRAEGRIETMICGDDDLKALDRRMAGVYEAPEMRCLL